MQGRSDQEYVWISNASNLPLFVERVYPGLESARKALQREGTASAGPTSVDLAAFITTVDAECTQNPAGVIVVGGWDDALASEVDKCIDAKVPTVVTDGDLLDLQAPDLPRHRLVQPRLPARPLPVPLPRRGRVSRPARSAPSRSSPRATSSPPARASAMRSPRHARTITVVADEESGTNVEQVAANTAAIIQGHPEPDRHGRLRLRRPARASSRAVTEAGKAGQIIVTSNEAGRDFLNSIKDGTVKMINMEKYETMDFFAVTYLLHLPQRHHPQPRHGPVAPEPAAGQGRFGPDLRHRRQCRHHPRARRPRRVRTGSCVRRAGAMRSRPGPSLVIVKAVAVIEANT